MKNLKALIVLLTFSASTFASEIKWDSLELSKQEVKAGGTKYKGSGFAGTALISENIIVSASRRVIDTDLSFYGYNANIEASQFNLGAGFKAAISESADFFMMVSYIDFKTKAEILGYSLRSSESGKGAQMGFRSMASDNLELTSYLNYTDVFSSETSAVLGAHYHLNDSFSLGIEYEKDSEERGTSIIARLYL